MNTNDMLITDFKNPVFQAMFKNYFAEIGMEIKDWDGLWEEMNGQEIENLAYIRTCDKEPAGFIQFTAVTFESWFFKEKAGFIREFWVSEKFRGKGFGTELLLLAEKYFKDKGINRVLLTAEENEQEFYINRGYSISGSIEAKNGMAVSVKDI